MADRILPPGFLQKLAERHGLALLSAPEEPASTVQASTSPLSRTHQFANLLGSAARATRSVAKTSLGIGWASDEQAVARLDVCRQCPGNHAVWKNGDVHTCGPMLASMKGQGEGTCGCILHREARDLAENCLFGWWSQTATGTHDDSG
jgi:hypothetical protein